MGDEFAIDRPWSCAFEDDVCGGEDDSCGEPHHECWFWSGDHDIDVEFGGGWPLIVWDFDVGDECADHRTDRNGSTYTSECTEEENDSCEYLCEGCEDRGDPGHWESCGFD